MYLILTYFNMFSGPAVLFSFPNQVHSYLEDNILRLFDSISVSISEVVLLEEKIKLLNAFFTVESKWARGGFEQIMLTVIRKETEECENCEEQIRTLVNHIKAIPNIFKAFYKPTAQRNDPEMVVKKEELKGIVGDFYENLQSTIKGGSSTGFLYYRVLCVKDRKLVWTTSYPVFPEGPGLMADFIADLTAKPPEWISETTQSVTAKDKKWLICHPYNLENWFLAVQYQPVSRQSLSSEQERIGQRILLETNELMYQKFSDDVIGKWEKDESVFAGFKDEINDLARQWIERLNRFDYRDNIWLAHFRYAEKIFTAILLSQPIYIVVESIENFQQDPAVRKLLATVEGLYSESSLNIQTFPQRIKIGHGPRTSNTIIITAKSEFAKIPTNGCVVEIQERVILSQVPTLPIAEKMVDDLLNLERIRIDNQMDRLRIVKAKVEKILAYYDNEEWNLAIVRDLLKDLEPDVRDAVIITLEQKKPELQKTLQALCNQELWDISRFLAPDQRSDQKSLEITCPHCQNKFKLFLDAVTISSSQVQELTIDSSTPNSCGHQFQVYVTFKNGKPQVEGYGRTVRPDDNGIRDIIGMV